MEIVGKDKKLLCERLVLRVYDRINFIVWGFRIIFIYKGIYLLV